MGIDQRMQQWLESSRQICDVPLSAEKDGNRIRQSIVLSYCIAKRGLPKPERLIRLYALALNIRHGNGAFIVV